MLKAIYYVLASVSGLISVVISITLKFRYWQYSNHYVWRIATKECFMAWLFAVITAIFIILIKCED